MRMPTHKQATATAVPMRTISIWGRICMPNTPCDRLRLFHF
jgi:hypothetical protein